jgi:hypothetical protein
MVRAKLCILGLLTVFSVLAHSQPPAAQRDPQSTYEPRSNPGAGQKFLERFVGDWEVAKAFYPRSGDPARSKGECRQTMIHGGRFLKSEFGFGQGPSQTTGTGIIGFDVNAGAFVTVWTDSRSTAMSLRQSQDKFNGSEIVLYSRSLAPNGTETRRSRTVTRLEDEGRRIVHRQFALNPDGQERLMMELVMTRKPAAASPGQ